MFRRLTLALCAILFLVIPIFTTGCQQPPEGSAEWYFIQASKLAQQGDYDDAIKFYAEAINVEPLMAKLYVNRAAAYGAVENYDAAIADCDEALSLDSNLPLAYINRAFAYNAKGN